MKAVLFAAGMGKRISASIGNMPKSLLEVNGKSLIKRSVEILKSFDLDIAVCTGYHSNEIERELSGLCSTYFLNSNYETTNNIYSLFVAKDFFDDDVIIMAADLFYDPYIIDSLIKDNSLISLVVDSARIVDGDYFLEIGKNNELISYGKDMPLDKRAFENVGMAKISKTFLKQFLNELNYLINNNQVNSYYEQIIFNLAKNDPKAVHYLDVKGLFWREIDNYDEYINLKKVAGNYENR